MQEFEINRYDYQKSGLISEANSYEIITDKITQRTVVVVQMKCFNQLGNGINNKIFLKSGEIVLNSNVETINLDAPTPKRRKPTDKLAEKK